MGVAALILGIVSLLMFIFHSSWAAGCGLAAVIFAAIGMKKQKGLSIAGLVLGIIALVIGLIFFLACGECGMCVVTDELAETADLLNDLSSYY